jgi:hypothetical protein
MATVALALEYATLLALALVLALALDSTSVYSSTFVSSSTSVRQCLHSGILTQPVLASDESTGVSTVSTSRVNSLTVVLVTPLLSL